MKFFNYIKKLIDSDNNNDSKELIFIITGVSIVVLAFVYTTTQNILGVLGIMTGYVLALAGVATYNKIKNQKNDQSK
jgi:predicted membrane channel-forming protein YqfA (hemolysin III family)